MASADTLRRLLAAFAVGGSFARGTADEASDLDLWIEGEDWRTESLGGLLLAGKARTMGGDPFLHAVTTGADPGDLDTRFVLAPLYERYVGPARLALLGLPLRTPEEIVFAVKAHRDEMSRRLPETTALERLARSLPLTAPRR